MSSPLVVDDVVIVYTDTLVAYDLDTGESALGWPAQWRELQLRRTS